MITMKWGNYITRYFVQYANREIKSFVILNNAYCKLEHRERSNSRTIILKLTIIVGDKKIYYIKNYG